MKMKRTTVVYIVIFAVIFLGWDMLLIVPELVEVMHTGMCPGMPPDGRPYPCTPTELLLREFSSPFAVAGQLLILIQSVILSLAVSFVVIRVWRLCRDRVWRHRHDDPGQ
jgi:hypothetical protein